MVTRAGQEETQTHFTRACKKHGDQHQWMQIGEQFFCVFCWGEFMEKHLGQLGQAKLCKASQT